MTKSDIDALGIRSAMLLGDYAKRDSTYRDHRGVVRCRPFADVSQYETFYQWDDNGIGDHDRILIVSAIHDDLLLPYWNYLSAIERRK